MSEAVSARKFSPSKARKELTMSATEAVHSIFSAREKYLFKAASIRKTP